MILIIYFCQHYVIEDLKKKFLNKQIKKEECQKYTDRCKLELDTFNELNFTNYILLVWTVINKAKELDIFLDFGRGSVSSSLSFVGY